MKRALVLGALTVAVALAAAGAGARAASDACPTSNAPNELVLAGGSGQQAQLGTQFAQNLQVALANTNGCPLTGNLAGITVNFDAPGSGASGIFAGSGSREAYVGTDSQGVATAPPFTANFTVGNYTVDAHSDYGTVELFLSNTANGLASAITATGITSQEATVNGSYAQPLQARVTDANGNPVQGANVMFAIVPGITGASATFLGGAPSATTDSNGVATSPPLIANAVPGRFTATASTAGVSTVAIYTLDNHATTTTLQTTSTRDPRATVDRRYRSSLQARLLDAGGQPIEGATVTFAITAADNGAAAELPGRRRPGNRAHRRQRTRYRTTAHREQDRRQLHRNRDGSRRRAGAVHPREPCRSTSRHHRRRRRRAIHQRWRALPDPARRHGHRQERQPGRRRHCHLRSRRRRGQADTSRRTRRIVRVRTNSRGIAVAPPFTANASAGGYVVTATVRRSSVRTAFSLLNLQRG